MSLNKVQLIGFLGRDPEIRSFSNGGKVANLRLATTETWRDRNTGERRERTEWHSIALHAEHAVRFAEQFLKKGARVYVEGQLETRKWQDQSGADRYSTEIVVRPYGGEIQSLDRRPEGERGGAGDQGGGYGAGSGGGAGGGYGGGSGPGTGRRSDLDDEIPF
ncbi:single-stranded DNA-binding protein [Defluviimonas sp. D31]|uniref:single-stranded DNA-binding protein n=1 Tax=Defluviimonas sp. D31 TaxID=3083253 RepID=UPI00296FE604|nr:single-stranded DNA-binding protein [Defluviimonas sp. D31]MDW4550867.1 single-stranded DNA-binding protein [Defluviimonas sp. D31]